MTKFKVGDRVERVIIRNTPSTPIGSKGTVTGQDDEFVHVLWDHKGGELKNCPQFLKLLPAEIVVGSLIRNVSDRDPYHDIRIGGVYRVLRQNGTKVEFLDDVKDYRLRPIEHYQLVQDLTEVPERTQTFTTGKTQSHPVAPRVPHPQTAGTYIVVKAEDGKLLPNANPKLHFTAADANKEAARLAGKHGGVFLTMVAAYRTEGSDPQYIVKTTSV